jgi:hypothetical protein
MADFPDIAENFSNIAENKLFKKLLLVLPLIAAIFLITDLMVISILVVLSLITPIFVKYAGIKMLGIELVTLTTILTAVELGPELGAIVGLVLMTAHMIAGQFSGAYILWVIPGYAVAGFLAGTVNLDITTLGIGIAVVLNTVFTGITAYLSPPGALSGQIPHAVGNIIFNSMLFVYVAPALMSMM